MNKKYRRVLTVKGEKTGGLWEFYDDDKITFTSEGVDVTVKVSDIRYMEFEFKDNSGFKD